MTAVAETFDCADPDERAQGINVALACLRRGEIIVMPTDTVYGVAADAFTPEAVSELLRAKGRGPDMPVPVLVGSLATMHAIATGVSADGELLAQVFWPGPLTVICHEQPSLKWDLGDTHGTVAVRIPDHPVALAVLARSGPLAVSSANRTGMPPPTTCTGAKESLGEAVSVYLDGGELATAVPSSIVDLTGPTPRLLRAGALTLERLREVVPGLLAPS